MNTSTVATIVSLLCAGCLTEGDLGSRSQGVSETPPPVHTPSCTPRRPPPATCFDVNSVYGIAEACVVSDDGTVLDVWSERVTLPSGTAGVFVSFNDLVVQPELAWPIVLSGPIIRDGRMFPEVPSCWMTVPDRRGLWVTLDEPVISDTPTSISIVVNFPTTHPVASQPGCVSCGNASSIVKFDIAAAD